MFLEFHFLLMSLSTILLFTWFIIPYFYLAEHLTRNGYTESDAANLLSIIGITNTIGMVNFYYYIYPSILYTHVMKSLDKFFSTLYVYLFCMVVL